MNRYLFTFLSTMLLSAYAGRAQVQATEPPHTATVAVFSINDFHGAFVQDVDKDIPGAASVLACLDSLKTVYPYHLTVAAGDNFGGSYFYKATKGALLPAFFDLAEINISAVGNHEFDDGQAEFARKWQGDKLRPANWNLTYVCANIYDEAGNIPPYMQPFTIAEVPLSKERSVKIALIGLLASSAKEQIKAQNTVGLSFSPRYTRVLDSIKALPEFAAVKESTIRSLLIHIGTKMENGNPVWIDKSIDELKAINDTFYHSILSGHSHEPVCGTINDREIPVLQGWWHGAYISVMKYEVDTLEMKVVKITPELVRVPAKLPSELTGKAKRLQDMTDSLLVNTKTAAGVSIGTFLTVCTEDLHHDRTAKFVDSPVGTLVVNAFAESYREAAHKKDKDIIIGVSHFGGIRAGISKGRLTVLDVGEVLPFGNPIRVYKVTGKELYKLVDYGYHNQYFGRMQKSYLETEMDADGHVKQLTYVSPKGKRKKIKDNTLCYIVADEYMTTGGDDYSPELFPNDKLVDINLPLTTDAFIKYLQQQPQLP